MQECVTIVGSVARGGAVDDWLLYCRSVDGVGDGDTPSLDRCC